jgi:D-lactate dehydrogenase (cytochrome)
MTTATRNSSPTLVADLSARLGRDQILSSDDDRRFFSHDVVFAGSHAVCCIVRPQTVEALRTAVAMTTAAGHAVIPRGGGASYTKGYLATTPEAVLIDTTALSRIVQIDTAAMTVTVECGVTWQALYDALRPLGVRTPFWGPMSGAFATVGGSLAQHAIIWGAARYGVSGDSVLGLDVVLADGSLLSTGSGGTAGSTHFYRNYGPDLTGLFLGDAGALGIKATATLRLMPTPAAIATASVTFPTHDSLANAMCALARAGVLSECFGLDPMLRRQRTRRAAIESGVAATPEALADARYALHMGCEGRSAAGVADDVAASRAICLANGGTEIDDLVPRLLRQHPWVTMTSAIGPAGERWAPLHGIVPLTDAVEAWNAVRAIVAAESATLDRLGIVVGALTSIVRSTAFVLEPVCYWRGPRSPYAARIYDAETTARFEDFAPDAESDAVVATLRERFLACFDARGAAHLQIGKAYHYRETRHPEPWALLRAIKEAVDPRGLMNPGALGLA